MTQQAGTHVSFRIRPDLRERLDRAAARSPGESRSALASRLIDEGLRLDAHPGLVFRSGPAGRRPGLNGGPDIWEVARVLGAHGTGEPGIVATAELSGLALHQVRVVARYYQEFAAEVDAWIARVDAEADELTPAPSSNG